MIADRYREWRAWRRVWRADMCHPRNRPRPRIHWDADSVLLCVAIAAVTIATIAFTVEMFRQHGWTLSAICLAAVLWVLVATIAVLVRRGLLFEDRIRVLGNAFSANDYTDDLTEGDDQP